jgi:Tol biopolymer transport system component
MGAVYRGRDTRLDRPVAIKIVHEEFSERFQSEARAISALNHPHICTLYDVGVNYLVMELVEGQTLARTLEGGPMPRQLVLRYGMQICEALAAAHAKGIVHRDLKPANIILARSGVKVLDFGVAKVEAPEGETVAASRVIAGTPAYMAPEQLAGRRCDARVDVYALGVVLAEMITGTRATHGTPVVTADVPPPLTSVVERCLAEDPDERWHAAADVKWALAQAAAQPASDRRSPVIWAAGAVAAIALTIGLAAGMRLVRTPVDAAAVSFEVSPPDGGSFQPFPGASMAGADLAMAPNGRSLAFVATLDGQTQLWIRDLASTRSHALSGTDGAPMHPFWSPDSRSIAYFDAGKLKRIEAAGGPPRDISDAHTGAWTGTWGARGDILFAAPASGIFRVSANGGAPTTITRVDTAAEREHLAPHFLPDGRRFLYTATDTNFRNRVYLGSTDSSSSALLMQVNSRVEYAAPGYLLFVRDRTLLAQHFDERAAVLQGDAFPVAERLQYFPPLGLAPFSASSTGVLAYQTGTIVSRLVWVDRSGREERMLGQPANYYFPRLSPDGRRVAIAVLDQQYRQDLYVFDVVRGTATRFTATPSIESSPAWSPDGRRIAFASDRGAPPFLHQKALDSGSDGEALLPPDGTLTAVLDWSTDGRSLLYLRADPVTNADVWVLPMEGDRKPAPLLNTKFAESDARLSPDGRWVAYVSDESGRPEVYVRSFPKPGEPRTISNGGGVLPRWRRDGKELFYVSGNQMMAAAIRADANFELDSPGALFARGSARIVDFDVAPDGRSFLVNSAVTSPENLPITIVVNWRGAPSPSR